MMDFSISFAAFFAALPAFVDALPALSAASAALPRPVDAISPLSPRAAIEAAPVFPLLPLFPVIRFAKDLKALASVTIRPSNALTALIAGVSTAINPCPMDALMESICSFKIRT